MEITSVKNEKDSIVFNVLISEKTLEEYLNREIIKASKNLKIPGYRPGKAPLEIAKKSVNESRCFINALNKIREKSEDWLVNQEDFKKYADDICDFEPIESKPENKDKIVSFNIFFGKYPEFKVKDINELKTDGLSLKITKEMIDNAINLELTNHETMSPKSGPAKKGDIVVIDFKGYIDNKLFEGGEAKNYELKLGSKSFIDNFEDQLIGLKAGDSKDVNVTFPKNYHVQNLQNKKAKFSVTVNVVNCVETPKLDNQFVKSLNLKDVNDVAAYKKHVEQNLKKDYEKNLDNMIQNSISQQLKEMVPKDLKIHEKLVINVAEIFLSRLMLSLIGKIVSLDDFVKIINGDKGTMTKEKLIDEEKVQAREYLKIRFALKQYAKLEKMSVTASEIDQEIENIIRNSKTTEKDIKDNFNVYLSIKREVLEKKVFDFIKQELLKKIK